MGYGRRALELLQQYYEGKIEFSGEEEEAMEEEEIELTAEVKPRKHLPPLLVSLNDRKAERLHVSVGGVHDG